MQHSAICDHCDQVIVGVRYRCGHCADYDLCASCEALHQSRVLHLLEKADDDEHDVARSIHPITHVFLKVRYPLPPRHDTSLGAFYHSIDQMRKSWWANHALEPSSATCETSQPAHPFLLCDGCDCSIIGVRYVRRRRRRRAISRRATTSTYHLNASRDAYIRCASTA